MGAKDSKPCFISYEDAEKRVSEGELRRIREAFKRCAGANGTALSLDAFVHEVLCDGVPYEVADWLYQACGGTKRGINFRDLLRGIVVLTKGSLEEKIKFLWTLYVNNQSDNGTYIYKRDFARALHLENTSLPVTGAQRSAEILLGLFGSGEKVTFEQFRSWLLIHKDATVLSKWLLAERGHVTQELETPTFYQSLAGVTHLEERDIIELEKFFWSLRNNAPTGQLDDESLGPLLSPPLPKSAVAGFFLAFDENRDDHIDFKELCCGLSAACRGPRIERLKFCFKIFDLDRDGVLNKKELIDMVGILCTVANESLKQQGSRASTPDGDSDGEKGFDPEVILGHLKEKLISVSRDGKPVFQLGPGSEQEDIVIIKQDQPQTETIIASDTALALEDFLIWSVEAADALVTPFLDLVFEVCHIVLGLRPQCRHRERDIVLGWLRREVQRGYSVGQFWYLVGAEWWGNWLAYTAAGSEACCRSQPRLDEAIVCDESFTSNSTAVSVTESMGSLLWRDTGSVGSASSSGVSSAHHQRHNHPGPVDNKRLLAPDTAQVRTLTGEGGHLRRDVPLSQSLDFELLPDALWRAAANWYGGPDPLPRQVIRPPNSDVELELYPLQLKIYRHVSNTQRAPTVAGVAGVGGAGGAGAPLYSSVARAPAAPDTQLAYTAAFSRLATVRQVCEFLCAALGLAREDMRLWVMGASPELLEDERPTLQALQLLSHSRLLLEVRNADLTWPEEITALSLEGGGSRASERRETLTTADMPGATGLHNLGNTCFMNAALQALWNTSVLRRYFNSGMHLYEVNTTNPLGTKGALALRFGELCKEVWSLGARSVAPLRMRWCVSRHARALAGGGQHDAQELLAWLLDALHEDLNRAGAAHRLHAPDSAGRPDQVVAAEAWEQYTARNQSIITDLFYGQLKSKVRCDTCGHESVRFDAFNMLSLPLPMECYVRFEVRVMLLDGSVPVKYGVRVNSEGTYLELKKKLSELCGLPEESMLLVELSGATLGRVLEDGARVAGAGAADLCVYETPPRDAHRADADADAAADEHAHNGWCGPEPDEEVSAPRAANTSSLCMPALFCFKSPPTAFYAQYTDNPGKSQTLPKDLRRTVSNSPTLSVKSLNVKPTSPGLKVKFGSSPSNMCRMNEETALGPTNGKIQYLVAVHRKQCRADAYFLPSQRCKPALFGVPILVPLREGMSGREIYALVWTQVARLLSARPPSHDQSNHATDCDDSLGYEFPFTLRLVSAAGGGAWCGACGWPALCRGCALPTSAESLVTSGPTSRVRKRPSVIKAEETLVRPDSPIDAACESPAARVKLQRQASTRHQAYHEEHTENGELKYLDLSAIRNWRKVMVAIDWDPTALHLRYQSTREKSWRAHASLPQSAAAEAARALALAQCLRAFTSSERLDARYACARCRSAQPATKKLQIWRLPAVLIIHLKRFQYVNNKWIKSQKVVNFPFTDFDPTDYLASVPQETILRHMEINNISRRRESIMDINDHISESDSDEEGVNEAPVTARKVNPKTERRKRESMEVRARERLESTSLAAAPVTADNLQDHHQHRLLPGYDPLQLQYRLCAVVSHSGQMSGGHYVAYARNPCGAWLCYNDSSCRELSVAPGAPPPVDPAAAYLLFYERRGLDGDRYLPDVAGKAPLREADEDPDDNDLKKMCVVM
ncbi:ubiquitin carboxyl-terminal hydrolase 32 isoform X2 [Plodia interpunctella]|uniref:ubiquitin carboxyl-terminal hydrolase 32 isoform X2 n=1 Tax=Plodia interpunctella TaxID=58824 RepID=UPI0023686D88|nr:ubiquitin carboxyl-terminal hydrolase 32 isoform X2 [Plodia interpunctella]